MIDLGLRDMSSSAKNGKKRRSTRIFQPISLSIYARNKLGNAFKDSTTALAVNCHGCLYSTRHEYLSGTWVTLEIPSQEDGEGTRAVRAQVRYVRLPQSPRELYQVGVELEAPGNIWGIQSPPDDWMKFPAPPSLPTLKAVPGIEATPIFEAPLASGNGKKTPAPFPVAASAPSAVAPPAPSAVAPPSLPANGQKPAPVASAPVSPAPASETPREPGKPVRVVVSPDQLLRALESKLQQSAEKAVAAAVTTQVGAAVNQAAKAIENFVQASIRRADDQCEQYREKLLGSAQQALVARLETNLNGADARLRTQLDSCLARAQQSAEQLERRAAEMQPVLDRAQEFLARATRELQEQCSATLSEAAAKASADFERSAASLAEARLARLAEQVDSAANEAGGRIESRADQVRLALETASGTALAEFHVMAKGELDRTIEDARQSVESSLGSLADETRAEWNNQREATRNELATAATKARQSVESSLASLANETHAEWEHRREAIRSELATAAIDARQTLQSELTSFAEETRNDWESRRQSLQRELSESVQRETMEFRHRLDSILNSSMMAAVTAVNEHARALLTTLAQPEDDAPSASGAHAAD